MSDTSKHTDARSDGSVDDDDYDNIDTMTPEQLKLWKLEMLRKLHELELTGVQLHQRYNLESDPYMMRYEYSLQTELLQRQHNIDLFKTLFPQLIEEFKMTNEQIHTMLYCCDPAIHK
jgi:hypothetical protein